MKRSLAMALLVVAGCTAPENRPDMGQVAVDTARDRALSQWKCTDTKGTVLGRTPMPMAASYAGPERIQYTVGVEGCGKSMNAIVICAAGTPCYVAGTDNKK